VACETTTHESLSRGTMPVGAFDGIIVDESHRFRPTSTRHAILARLACRAPLLLLSATPLQNHARELAALIALFLGETAYVRELATWQGGDAVQLGFPTMLAAEATDRACAEQHAREIEAERSALEVVMGAIEHARNPDASRVRALREVCRNHGDVSVLAFSEY